MLLVKSGFFPRLFIAYCLLFISDAYAAELNLATATQRMLAQHPQLHEYQALLAERRADVEVAGQLPSVSLGLGVENAVGSGNYRRLRGAETTLSIGSVLRLGNKRAIQQRLAAASTALTEAQKQAALLRLTGQITERFVASLAVQQQCALAERKQSLLEQISSLVKQRVAQAASPQVEALRAKAASERARLTTLRCRAELIASYQQLAQVMGQKVVDFSHLQGDLLALHEVPVWSTLRSQLATSPQLQVWTKRQALQQQQLERVRANNVPDVTWRLGATRFSDGSDVAFGVGVEVPLFSNSYNRSHLAITTARGEQLNARQQQAEQALLADLATYLQAYQGALSQLKGLQSEVLPLLDRAYQQAKEAYRQGRYDYTAWANAAQEMIDAKAQLIEVARQGWVNLARIEAIVGASSWK